METLRGTLVDGDDAESFERAQLRSGGGSHRQIKTSQAL